MCGRVDPLPIDLNITGDNTYVIQVLVIFTAKYFPKGLDNLKLVMGVDTGEMPEPINFWPPYALL